MEEDQGDYKNNERNNSVDGDNNNTKENFEDSISADLGREKIFFIPFIISFFSEKKLRSLNEFAKGKNEEQTLNIRMHQLALAKV